MVAPLTSPEIDLQDFPFMPLHVARLRDSDLAASEHPEACWYAVLLWCASWHQIPAASLPDDDMVLARLCGLGRDVKTFRKHKAGALRGFILCDDGRLYHPVVAEQAREGWEKKLQQRWRTECARIRKANQRNETDLPSPTFDEFVARDRGGVSHGTEANVPSDKGSKGQGQGQGQGQGNNKKEDEQPRYAFSGETIRLTARDLAHWGSAYHAIPDIRAELTALDGWLQGPGQAKRKTWFHTVSGALNRKHQEMLAAGGGDDDESPLC